MGKGAEIVVVALMQAQALVMGAQLCEQVLLLLLFMMMMVVVVVGMVMAIMNMNKMMMVVKLILTAL